MEVTSITHDSLKTTIVVPFQTSLLTLLVLKEYTPDINISITSVSTALFQLNLGLQVHLSFLPPEQQPI